MDTAPTAAPILGRLVLRPGKGVLDYPAMAAVIGVTVEEIARMYLPRGAFDPKQQVTLGIIDSAVVGFGRHRWWGLRNGTQLYGHIGYVHPDWRGGGVERALLRANERHLRALGARQLHEGAIQQDAPRMFTYIEPVIDTQLDIELLLRGEGYDIVRRSYDMVRPSLDDLPDTALPAGIVVRPVEPEQHRSIWEAKKDAFRDHFGSTPATEEEYQAWLSNPHFDPSLWQVAWDGDQVAGMVLSFIDAEENRAHNRRRGYTDPIGVRRPWRRRGLARALLVRSLHVLKENGMTEAGLNVDTENQSGALHLYDGVGFRVVKRASIFAKAFSSLQVQPEQILRR